MVQVNANKAMKFKGVCKKVGRDSKLSDNFDWTNLDGPNSFSLRYCTKKFNWVGSDEAIVMIKS